MTMQLDLFADSADVALRNDAPARKREATAGATAASAVQLLGDAAARSWLVPLWIPRCTAGSRRQVVR